MNASALRMFGWTADEILNQPLDLLLPKSVGGRHHAYVRAFQRSPIRARGMQERSDVYGVRRNGDEFAVQISISKVVLEGGVETTAIVRDVSDTVRLIADLQMTASVDSLTGLSTRRRFLQALELELELERVRRDDGKLSLLMLDVDHFKQVNDRFGHPVGDSSPRASFPARTRASALPLREACGLCRAACHLVTRLVDGRTRDRYEVWARARAGTGTMSRSDRIALAARWWAGGTQHALFDDLLGGLGASRSRCVRRERRRGADRRQHAVHERSGQDRRGRRRSRDERRRCAGQ